MKQGEILYAVTTEDLQSEALHTIGRTLNEDELEHAKKGIEFGIGESMSIIYQTIFAEMVEK